MKKVSLVLLSSFIGGLVAFTLPKIFKHEPAHELMSEHSNFQGGRTHFVSGNTEGGLQEGCDFTEAAEKTIHSVVHIQAVLTRKASVYDDFFYFFSNPYRNKTEAYNVFGSGVIISDDGYIITNNHVVQEADSIKVTLNDKRSYKAKLIGKDPSSDLALIKIEAKHLQSILFGNSDETRIGQWVLAVGNPYNLTSTVTAGIISAKARNINILGENSSEPPIESFIQTDAAVNPGNSGGALININGDLIGINTAIKSNTGNFTGYSFAIPSNIVKKIALDLKKHGTVQRAYLGVQSIEMDDQVAGYENVEMIPGVYIARVIPDGAAEKAGLKKGDIIIEVNNKRILSFPELTEVIAQYSPGEKITLVYQREKKQFSVQLELLNKTGSTSVVKPETTLSFDFQGVKFSTLTTSELKKMRIHHGVSIVDVANSEFARIGIRNGFVITYVDDKAVQKKEDLEVLKTKKGRIIIEGVYPGDSRTYFYMLVL